MTVAERLDPFVGRASEVALLRSELAAARAGTPRVLVVQGDAGIGKTVLLDRFLTDEPELTVLRATGEPWEAYVAYGVIDQLMRVAGVSTTRLLVSRDRSFPPEEPVGVGAWILDVVKELSQKATVVMIVDDAHWADRDSLRALLFAARRWVDERVLLVLGQRAEDEQRLPEGLRRLAGGRTGLTLALQPLPPSDVHELASALGVRGFSAREPLAAPTCIAAIAQFALLEVGRLDDIVRAGVAGSAPGIAEGQPWRPYPSHVFQAAGRHKKGTRHNRNLAKAVS